MPYGWTILEILGVVFGVVGIYYGITEAQFLTAGLGFYATSATVAYHSADADREDLLGVVEEARAGEEGRD